ncbi:MAG: hypothetical protein IH840_18135 [Candidatus Heimdallarchaeota archaeon]|nr:hypothetical protein [Candidatus Heimdallarchaeota archaeon]
MFWRKKKSTTEELDLPPLDELEVWVPAIISSLNLQKGEFTILPAFGGIIMYIRSQGIAWIPYKEIKKTLGRIDKSELGQRSAIIGGTAVAAVAGASLIPIIMMKGSLSLLKQSYKSIIKPPPTQIIMYLQSIIDKIIILQEKKFTNKIIDRMAENPFKDETSGTASYKLYVKKKFFDRDDLGTKNKFLSTLKQIASPDSFPEFTIPEQANIDQFAKILTDNGLTVHQILDTDSESVKSNH